MFYYDGNNENFEAEISQYIALNKNQEDKLSYEIGKGWPNYTLEDLEKATGLGGREYGFDPGPAEQKLEEYSQLEAVMPKFEMASIRLGTREEEEGFSNENEAHNQSSASDLFESDLFDRDLNCMKNLACEISGRIQPFIDQALNEFAYEGSPIMNVSPEREFIEKLAALALKKAAIQIPEIEEILQDTEAQRISWSRYGLLKALFESVVLKELFLGRRPKCRQILGWQIS